MAKRQDVRKRFEAMTVPEPNSGCLLWLGSVGSSGYGQICVNGRMEYAHRVAWALAGHELTAMVCVLHKCDNPPCCNHRHLFDGTRAANSIDMALKGRGRRSKQGLPPGVAENRDRRRRRFVARVTLNGIDYYLGNFDTPTEAGQVSAAFRTQRRNELAALDAEAK